MLKLAQKWGKHSNFRSGEELEFDFQPIVDHFKSNRTLILEWKLVKNWSKIGQSWSKIKYFIYQSFKWFKQILWLLFDLFLTNFFVIFWPFFDHFLPNFKPILDHFKSNWTGLNWSKIDQKLVILFKLLSKLTKSSNIIFSISSWNGNFHGFAATSELWSNFEGWII